MGLVLPVVLWKYSPHGVVFFSSFVAKFRTPLIASETLLSSFATKFCDATYRRAKLYCRFSQQSFARPLLQAKLSFFNIHS